MKPNPPPINHTDIAPKLRNLCDVLGDDGINHFDDMSHRVIFDRSEGKFWEEKIFHRSESFGPYEIRIWRM